LRHLFLFVCGHGLQSTMIAVHLARTIWRGNVWRFNQDDSKNIRKGLVIITENVIILENISNCETESAQNYIVT